MRPPSIEAVAARLDALVRRFEQHPDQETRGAVLDMLGTVDALHRPGLTALVHALASRAPDALGQLAADPAVRTLLELYDLVPPVERVEAEQALSTVAAEMNAPGSLVLLDILEGVAHVRVEPPPMAAATLAGEALARRLRLAFKDVPEITDVRLHPATPAPEGRVLPMADLRGR